MCRVLYVSNCTHSWLIGHVTNQGDIIEQLHIKTVRFIMTSHKNQIVNLVATRALINARSPMGANVTYLIFKYGIVL